jgi:putative hydrolase of the HAD superfamily
MNRATATWGTPWTLRRFMPFPSSPARAVLFDAVGTLLRPDPPVVEVYQAAGRRFGCDLAREEVAARFRQAFAQQEKLDAEDGRCRTSEPRERERWRTIVGEVFPLADDAEGLFAALWDHFADPRHWSLLPDVAVCWRELEARGLILGVASNFDARLTAICHGLPPLNACLHVFVSSRLGFRKPGQGFFRAIETALCLRPDEIVLVGDDLENDYIAARKAGWQAVFLNRREQSGPRAADEVACLDELLA